jgi:transcription antitermination factor NusG
MVAEVWDGFELDARRSLRAADFQAEYPLTRLPRTSSGERRVIPLFPGYVFVRESESWRSIPAVRGIVRLIMNNGCPSLVRDVDVQFFMTGSVDELGYYVDPVMRLFRCGDPVRPRSGRFAGILGEFTRMMDSARCEVQFSMLGRVVTSTHPVADLT